MSDHTVSVLRHNEDGKPQAICGCNWEGPPRARFMPLTRAIGDAMFHAAEAMHQASNPLIIDPYSRSVFGPVQKWGTVDRDPETGLITRTGGITIAGSQLEYDVRYRRTWREAWQSITPWWAWIAATGAVTALVWIAATAPAEQDWPAGNSDVTCQVTR